MYKYIRKILFSFLVLMMPYMNSASKAMMGADDYEGSTGRTHKVSDDTKDVSSSVKRLTASQVVSLDDSNISWASYLMSPVTKTTQYLITEHPRTIITLCTAVNLTAYAADCVCKCYSPHTGKLVISQDAGQRFPNQFSASYPHNEGNSTMSYQCDWRGF